MEEPKIFEDKKLFESAVNKTGYYQLMSTILKAVNDVVSKIHNDQNVLVHCSDGWDRTAQMTVLS